MLHVSLQVMKAIGVGGILVFGSMSAAAAPDASAEDTQFLEQVFALTNEVALLNAEVIRWLRGPGAEGLYPSDYLARAKGVGMRMEAVVAPARVQIVRRYLVESLRLQRIFVAEWFDAKEAGRPFESQLTDEYAYHEGLHRSHRLLLKTYAELRVLFPAASDETLRAFQDHLRGMDLR